jgi:hypothetical protein
VLDRLADALVEKETLDTPELTEIFSGLPTWEVATGNGSGNGAKKPATRTRRPRTTTK